MISRKEVLHIAGLARIKLSEKEIEKMQNDLSLILDYMAKINTLEDIKDTMPTFYSVETKNQLREDEVISQDLETVRNIISLAPSKERGFIKTKPVFKKR